jgi:hypothetical protein
VARKLAAATLTLVSFLELGLTVGELSQAGRPCRAALRSFFMLKAGRRATPTGFRSFGDPFGCPVPQRLQPFDISLRVGEIIYKEGRPGISPRPAFLFANFANPATASPPPPPAPAPPTSRSEAPSAFHRRRVRVKLLDDLLW